MKHLVIALISLIALNMLQANTLDNTIYLHKNQNNVAIYKGQQIKINDDKRKLFFQGYNSVSNTITVKDISYKVIYTKRKKIDYNISEINRIQLRLDKSLIRNILLWYPNFYVHLIPPSLLTGIVTILYRAIADVKEKDAVLGDGSMETWEYIIFSGIFYSVGTAFINSWPTVKKLGKGRWLSIPLKGDDKWQIKIN
jgi:hypothetical protein